MSHRRGSADYRHKREVSLDIHGVDKSVVQEHKDEIVFKLRLLYCVIERLADSGEDFSLDDIVSDYRHALTGDGAFGDLIDKARTKFPLRADLVSVGREFRGCFEYVSPAVEMKPGSLSDYIDAQVIALRHEKKESRARSYSATHAKLKEFTGKDNLSFSVLSRAFIENFAEWMKTGNITASTQSFYLRTLRSILNHAREEHLLTGADNWFRDVDTRILFDRTTGKDADSLGRETLKEIRRLDLSDDHEASMARDMFMFGFYCHGMELVDIAHLTPENIQDGYLVYSRRHAGKEISLPLDPDALRIIRQYESADSHYLFPFLYDDGRCSFHSMRNRMQIAIKKVGNAVGFSSLSFSMNIAAYKNVLLQNHISDMI